MTRMYYRVTDCEHEGDVRRAVYDLGNVADFNLESTNYEYEDDEDPDADHEICGCELVLQVRDEDVDKFKEFGCY